MIIKMFISGILAFTMLHGYAQQQFEVSVKAAKIIVKKYPQLNRSESDSEWQSIDGEHVAGLPDDRKFKAPIRSQDPSYQKIDVLESTNTAFVTPEGYIIKIGEADLVDANGQAVNGGYTLYFRDLTDVGALAMSGVPMNYDSGGTSGYFQTAGMFELYAEKNGQPLQIKAGEAIDIVLPSPDAAAGYNLYTFNEVTGEWKFDENLPPVNDEKSLVLPDSVPIYSDAYRFLNLLRINSDSVTFHERWLSSRYARTKNIENMDAELLSKQRFSILKIENFRLARISDKGNRKAVLFQWPVLAKGTDDRVFYRQFPEFSTLRNVTWQYQGPLDRKGFFKTYIYKRKYLDARVSYDQGSGYFSIYLKRLNGVDQINAIPYKGKYTFTDKATKPNQQLALRYEKSLLRAERKFDNKNHNLVLAQLEAGRAKITKQMSPEELAMNWNDWLLYAQAAANYQRAVDNRYSKVSLSRSISIVTFGLVNCDKVYRMIEPVQIIASFVLPDGSVVDQAQVILVDGLDRTCLNYSMADGSVASVVERNSANVFGVVLQNEEFYVVNASSFKTALGSGNLSQLPLVKVDGDATEAINKALKM